MSQYMYHGPLFVTGHDSNHLQMRVFPKLGEGDDTVLTAEGVEYDERGLQDIVGSAPEFLLSNADSQSYRFTYADLIQIIRTEFTSAGYVYTVPQSYFTDTRRQEHGVASLEVPSVPIMVGTVPLLPPPSPEPNSPRSLLEANDDVDLGALESDLYAEWHSGVWRFHPTPFRLHPPFELTHRALTDRRWSCVVCCDDGPSMKSSFLEPDPAVPLRARHLAAVGLGVNDVLPGDVVLSSECGHVMCVACMRRLMSSPGVISVFNTHPACPAMGDDCQGVIHLLDLQWVLSLREFREVEEKYFTHMYEEALHFPCPEERWGVECGHPVPVPCDDPPPFVNCLHCYTRLCCTCHLPSDGEECEECNIAVNGVSPFATNQFIRIVINGSVNVFTNGELPPDVVVLHIDRILYGNREGKDVAVPAVPAVPADYLHEICPDCGVALERTVMCNALAHCGWEICNWCGEAFRGEIPSRHWTETVRGKGCPRYDQNVIVSRDAPLFLCVEGECHDEQSACCEASHAAGRRQYTDLRKTWHLYFLLRSLLAPLRNSVLDHYHTNTYARSLFPPTSLVSTWK
jgi:hypothetical protein